MGTNTFKIANKLMSN